MAISVDQFSAQLFERYRTGYSGGLKRLSGGIAFANGYQSHAATETCPGHSTILTGRHPAATGIAANSWFDVATGSSIYCVAVRGTADPDARGPQNLLVPAFGEWLKAQASGARVIAVSGKDRAAIMMAGHKPDAVYWWKDGKGFGTSSHAGPADARVTAPAAAFDAALFKRWRSAPPPLWPSHPSATCAALVEPHKFGDLTVSGRVPPDGGDAVETGPDFIARSDFADALHASPLFDHEVLDFAARLVDQRRLGRGRSTDLLAISLSATDYIGHRYGNGGAEMCAQMAALDADLGAFFTKLDADGVRYAVVLTADHGAADAAERAAEHGVEAVRIDGGALVGKLNARLKQALGLAYEPIVGDDPQQLVINIAPGDPALRAKIESEAIAWLRQQPQVAQVFTAAEIVAAVPKPRTPPDMLSLPERFHESYYPGRSGDIIVAFAENATIGHPRVAGDVVAGHGSVWDYDRRVPILFWWPGAPAANRPEPIETVDIAPTLSAMAGVRPPKMDGRCLAAVARCP